MRTYSRSSSLIENLGQLARGWNHSKAANCIFSGQNRSSLLPTNSAWAQDKYEIELSGSIPRTPVWVTWGGVDGLHFERTGEVILALYRVQRYGLPEEESMDSILRGQERSSSLHTAYWRMGYLRKSPWTTFWEDRKGHPCSILCTPLRVSWGGVDGLHFKRTGKVILAP